MSIKYQNTQISNLGLGRRGSNPIDAFRKSLGGLSSNLQGIDDKRDEKAKNAFADRLAGMSVNELEGFDIDSATKGNRLEAVTLRDMLRQRTNDARIEQEQNYLRQKRDQERINNPILQEWETQVNELRMDDTNKDAINKFTEKFIKERNLQDNPELVNQLTSNTFNIGNAIQKQNRAENEYQYKLSERARLINERNKNQQQSDNYNNGLNQLTATYDKGYIKDNNLTHGQYRERLLSGPTYDAMAPKEKIQFNKDVDKWWDIVNRPTEEQIEAGKAYKKRAKLDYHLLDSAEETLKEIELPKSNFIDLDETAKAKKNILNTIYTAQGHKGMDTTAGGNRAAGTEIIDLYDKYATEGLEIEGSESLKPEDIDPWDVANLITEMHENGNLIRDEGIPNVAEFEARLYKIADKKRNNKVKYGALSQSVEAIRQRLMDGGTLNESERKILNKRDLTAEDILKANNIETTNMKASKKKEKQEQKNKEAEGLNKLFNKKAAVNEAITP